jgi:hypothetical protein
MNLRSQNASQCRIAAIVKAKLLHCEPLRRGEPRKTSMDAPRAGGPFAVTVFAIVRYRPYPDKAVTDQGETAYFLAPLTLAVIWAYR